MAYMSFDKLKAELSHRPGVTNPGALAASVGRKKYGKKAFQHAAASGTSLKGHKTVKSDRHKALAKFVKKHG
jgi:hypothetical protein